MRHPRLLDRIPFGRALLPVASAALAVTLVAGCGSDDAATADTSSGTTAAAAALPAVSAGVTAEEVMAENQESHDDAADHEWDAADEIAVTLGGDSATSDSDAVSVSDGVLTITAAGTYRLSGSFEGTVVVDTEDEGVVRLVLDGVEISSDSSAAIDVENADLAMIVLADGSQNTLSDADSYVYPDDETDEPNAALFSTADLTITGTGSLTVNGNFEDGIASKDGLVIDSATITVTAVDDGIRGKDYVIVNSGTIGVTAGDDGVTSTNEDESERGYVLLAGGSLDVTAGGDGVQAATDLVVTGGTVGIETAGGADAAEQLADDTSAKGLKGAAVVVVADGTVTVDAADDAVHSDQVVSITGGDLTLASGDDGIHGETALDIAGGTVDITTSYEGLEAEKVTISGGDIAVTSSDDGVNGSAADDTSTGDTSTDGTDTAADGAQQDAQQDGRQGGFGGGMGGEQDDPDVLVTISGGTLTIDAGGDGLDSNGSMEITGGTVVVNGPTNNGNGALDVNGTFTVSGGDLAASGSAGMAVAPDADSPQAWVAITFDAAQSAGSVVRVVDSSGNVVATVTPTKEYQSVVISSSAIESGATYDVQVDGSTVTTVTAGEFTGGMGGGMGGGPGGGMGGGSGGGPGGGSGGEMDGGPGGGSGGEMGDRPAGPPGSDTGDMTS